MRKNIEILPHTTGGGEVETVIDLTHRTLSEVDVMEDWGHLMRDDSDIHPDNCPRCGLVLTVMEDSDAEYATWWCEPCQWISEG